MTARPVTVAVSGPDGAGKSTLVRRLAAALEDEGFGVATAYCYGCFVCRRAWRSRTGPADAGAERGAAGPDPALAARWPWTARAHAVLDATELAARLTRARLRARRRAGRRAGPGAGRKAAVVTDRGPLDALAKFDPPAGCAAAALFAAAGRRWDLTLLLDAPAEVLAARDREHSSGQLQGWRERYRTWSGRLPPVILLDADVPADALARAAAAAVTARTGGPRVVISSFDSLGNPYYRGGGAQVAEALAGWLSREFPVTVVTAGRGGGSRLRDGARYRSLPVTWAGPRGGQLLFHALLPLAARRIPHELWIESFTPPFSTSFVPLFSRAPVVGLAQSLSGAEMSRRYRLPFWLVEEVGLRRYRDVVVLNPADGERVRRVSPSTRVRVIPNFVERPPLDERRIGQGGHIAFLGRIHLREKGLDLLAQAYVLSGASMPLIIAGGGARAQERKLTALLAAVPGDARWVGPVSGERKRDLLERAAFLVMPSRQEAFGLVALEAMARGKPVVHFDLPSLRWMDGDLRVRPFDVAGLARAIADLAGDAGARRELGRAAYAATARFTPQAAAERYLALARELLGAGAPEARG